MDKEYKQSSEDIYDENNIIWDNIVEDNDKDGKKFESDKEQDFNIFREIMEVAIYFIIVLTVFLFVQHFVGQHIEVNGSSMNPTLFDEDHLILEKLSYRFNDPKRFDIVVFRPYQATNKEDIYYIKRVIGLPGEKVQIKEGLIYINGEQIEEDYGNELIEINHFGIAKDEVILGEEEYFLMGDNRNHSTDSRSERIGPVHIDAIVGRAWTRIWPLKKLGIINH